MQPPMGVNMQSCGAVGTCRPSTIRAGIGKKLRLVSVIVGSEFFCAQLMKPDH
jgi:hypothetical protein